MLSPVEEIKSRLDIVEFIQGYVRLQKAGANFRANCPFHGEKTPSFFVTPSRQMWHCFGCSKGGDIFQFIMEMEGHDFPEALKLLAARAGIALTREDPRIRSERNRLYDINEEAARIFQQCFSNHTGAKEYIAKRGLNEETVAKFRVGFAPQSWDFLLNALIKKGFTKEDIERAGLAIKNQEKGSWYDRFRSRIMFPIKDASGRVIGFGGRIFAQESGGSEAYSAQISEGKSTEGQAKYINTPQTMIYDKSSVLYAFDIAKQDIRIRNQAVLVEGYMDCVMSHQAGVTHTVAVSGTALTPRQLQMLRRLCDTIVCSFDTDAAGESATRRSLALASEFDFERRVAHIHTGKDPADAVRESPALWQVAVKEAKPVVDFYVEKAFAQFDPATASGKKSITDMVLPFVADLFDAIQQDHWTRQLASRLDVSETSIRSELARRPSITEANRGGQGGTPGLRTQTENSQRVEPQYIQGRRELLEEKFLTLLAMVPEEVRERELKEHHIIFRSAEKQNLFALVTASLTSGASTSASVVQDLEMFKFKSEVIGSDIEHVDQEFLICKRDLERECIKEKMQERQEEIAQKEKEGSHAAVNDLLKDMVNLNKILKQLSVS